MDYFCLELLLRLFLKAASDKPEKAARWDCPGLFTCCQTLPFQFTNSQLVQTNVKWSSVLVKVVLKSYPYRALISDISRLAADSFDQHHNRVSKFTPSPT